MNLFKIILNSVSDYFKQTSIYFTLKEKKHRLKDILRIACVWRWQLNRLPNSQSVDARFYYLGRKSELEGIVSYLGLAEPIDSAANIKAKAIVSELPIPGAICLPLNLSTVIPLKNRTPDDVLIGFEKRKRRLINSQISQFRLEKISIVEEIIRLNQTVLIPYANARFGRGAYLFPMQQLIEMTFKTGQFNLLLHGNKEVGCIIGHFSKRNRQRYWQSDRMGFPEFIFSDMQRYRETNVIITYLQILWAINNDSEYYDMGANPAYTESGVVHHKRTFGGHLSTMGNYSYLYLKLPSSYAAKFYWGRPLFALEGKSIVLHLGLPNNISDAKLCERYKQLSFNGLAKVYLHYEIECSASALEAIKSIFSQQKLPPSVIALGQTRK